MPPTPQSRAVRLISKSEELEHQDFTFPPNAHDLMRRLASGATVEEIAASWNRTPRTVYLTLADIKRTLSARTTYHALAIWIGQGRLPFNDGARQ